MSEQRLIRATEADIRSFMETGLPKLTCSKYGDVISISERDVDINGTVRVNFESDSRIYYINGEYYNTLGNMGRYSRDLMVITESEANCTSVFAEPTVIEIKDCSQCPFSSLFVKGKCTCALQGKYSKFANYPKYLMEECPVKLNTVTIKMKG